MDRERLYTLAKGLTFTIGDVMAIFTPDIANKLRAVVDASPLSDDDPFSELVEYLHTEPDNGQLLLEMCDCFARQFVMTMREARDPEAVVDVVNRMWAEKGVPYRLKPRPN